MADLVYSASDRARARARRRELAQAAPLLARLDWVMLAAVAGIVALRALGDRRASRAHDVPGDPAYYVYRQLVFVAVGAARLRRHAIARRPGASTGGSTSTSTSGTLAALRARLRWPGRWRAARGAGSTSASSGSSRPSSGSCSSLLVLAGFLADRFRRIGDARTVLGDDRARPAADRCSSSSSRTSARRSSTWPRSAPCCSSPARAGSHLGRVGAIAGARARVSCSGCCPRPAWTCSSRTRRTA